MANQLQPVGPQTLEMDNLLKACKDLHHKLYEHLSLIDEMVKKNQIHIQDLGDIGFLCREAEDLLDEMRKNAKSRKEFISRTLVMKWTAAAMTPSPLPDSLKGQYASVSNFRIKKMPELPEFGGEDYILYMRSLGVPEDVIKRGLVKPDWEMTVEHITSLTEEGKKLPPGIGQTWNIYTCTFTRNRRQLRNEDDHD